MNKTDMIEILQRRTTKLAVLSSVSVGVMIFLASAIVEEADAIISAKATSTAGPFFNA